MHREGHIGAALLAYAPLGLIALAVGARALALLGGLVAVAGAMLPDLDMRVPLVPHRGPTHTVWFAAAVGVVGALAGVAVGLDGGIPAAAGSAAYGFLVGAVTVGAHLAADALTPMGIQPWTPLSKRTYSLELVHASSPIANYLLLAGGIAVAAGAAAAGTTVATWL